MFRVSDVIRLYFPEMWASQDQLDSGTYRHDLIEQALKWNDFTVLDGEPELVGLARWLRDEVLDILYVEHEFKNDTHGYRGHPDATLLTKSYGQSHFDWKPKSPLTKANLLQAAAYSNFLSPAPFLKCHLVQLQGEKVTVTKFEHDAYLWTAFTYGLKVLQLKEAMK